MFGREAGPTVSSAVSTEDHSWWGFTWENKCICLICMQLRHFFKLSIFPGLIPMHTLVGHDRERREYQVVLHVHINTQPTATHTFTETHTKHLCAGTHSRVNTAWFHYPAACHSQTHIKIHAHRHLSSQIIIECTNIHSHVNTCKFLSNRTVEFRDHTHKLFKH